MLQPPSLKSIPRYPVTAGLAALAITATGLWGTGSSIDGLAMDVRVWDQWQLWRAWTSILPHVGIFHLAFNIYWLWVFGTLVEQVYGHLKMAGIVAVLAFGSMLAEFCVFSGGVGLSGVGYGLWGMLWVLERRDARFAGVVDKRTSQTFVIWFFVCIVLTISNVMPVANVAHGVGAGLGLLLGLAASSEGSLKLKSISGLVAATLLFVAGATVLWPWVNFSKEAKMEIEAAGLDALEAGQTSHAVKLLETAAHMRNAPARIWYNLGVAYESAKQDDAALAAFEHAAAMPDSKADFQKTAQKLKEYLTIRNALRKAGQP